MGVERVCLDGCGATGPPRSLHRAVAPLSALALTVAWQRPPAPHIRLPCPPPGPSLQHFATPDGSYPGGNPPFKCSPLHAYFAGNASVRAGGPYNAPIAPLLPRIADAHLRTW